MSGRGMTLLQVDTADVGGGAERVMSDLHAEYLRRGLDPWIAVGFKRSDDPRVLEIPNDALRSAWARSLSAASARAASSPGRARLAAARALLFASDPRRYGDILAGLEDSDFPGTSRILDLPPEPVDVLHLHNLHGGYFDLRELPRLTSRVPTVITMHDAWLLTGHCAHPFDCPRWRTGCGECPYPDVYVPIRRDASAENRRRKRDILGRSRLHLATPSRWLMRMVEESGVLGDGGEARVIPNGVDTRVFRPGDKAAARADLGLPPDAEVVLFASNALEDNPFKDYATLLAALPEVARSRGGDVRLVALGATGVAPRVPGATVLPVPFEPDPARVALHLQAADLYVHPARAENLPLAVIEAMACGVAVVASRVGGIPEIVEDGRTGSLVDVGDVEGLAAAMIALLAHGSQRAGYAEAGLERVRRDFTLARQADAYIAWYEELLGRKG